MRNVLAMAVAMAVMVAGCQADRATVSSSSLSGSRPTAHLSQPPGSSSAATEFPWGLTGDFEAPATSTPYNMPPPTGFTAYDVSVNIHNEGAEIAVAPTDLLAVAMVGKDAYGMSGNADYTKLQSYAGVLGDILVAPNGNLPLSTQLEVPSDVKSFDVMVFAPSGSGHSECTKPGSTSCDGQVFTVDGATFARLQQTPQFAVDDFGSVPSDIQSGPLQYTVKPASIQARSLNLGTGCTWDLILPIALASSYAYEVKADLDPITIYTDDGMVFPTSASIDVPPRGTTTEQVDVLLTMDEDHPCEALSTPKTHFAVLMECRAPVDANTDEELGPSTTASYSLGNPSRLPNGN